MRSVSVVLAVAALGAVGGASLAIARGRWNRATFDTVSRLYVAHGRDRRQSEVTALPDLPPPVARYLAFALPGEAPAGDAAFIRWRGEFRTRPEGGWAPFTAVQHFTAHPLGFVWDARIRMMPLVSVRVRDAYIGGEGSMRGRIAALVPVVNEGGTPEMAQSALGRWLGEAVWFPAALGTDGPVRWEAVDARTARAVVTDGPVRAEAEFHFASSGEIVRMTAMRYRDVDGTPVLTPFEGRYGAYERRAGVRVPLEAEVAWDLPEGRYAYWRGRPEEIAYYVAPAEGRTGAR